MKILDKGHIYKISNPLTKQGQFLKFVKRSGGAITYTKEWPGIQTQVVMRALIDHLEDLYCFDKHYIKKYYLWQLGSKVNHPLVLGNRNHLRTVLKVVIDRSIYLNEIISCIETQDAIYWLNRARIKLQGHERTISYEDAIYGIRMALWNYEARAYRRKQEGVNRKQPTHDDTARLKHWKNLITNDVPFDETYIEKRPIGEDGHILL